MVKNAIHNVQKIDNLIGWNIGNTTCVTLEQKSVLFQRHPHNTRNATLAPASYCEPGSALGNAICMSYA